MGIAVLAVRTRTRTTLALAAFTSFFGAGFVAYNLLTDATPAKAATTTLEGAGFALAALAILVLAREYGDRRRALRRAATAFGAVYPVLFFLLAWSSEPGTEVRPAAGPELARVVGLAFAQGASWGGAALFALTYARSPREDDAARRRLALMGTTLVAYATAPASLVFFARDPTDTYDGLLTLALGVVLATVWLRAMARSHDPRPARSAAWVLLALLATFMWAGTRGAFYDVAGYVVGAARTLAVALLAYAILRHRLLGLDVRLRWTISRGTVAAVFVAAFFVTTELARDAFSAQAGPILCILAAGLLVFALAPLQRLTDRLATRVVPVIEPAHASRTQEPAYRVAVRLALRDPRLSPAEEVQLFRVAEALGGPAGRAMEIRHEVEREALDFA